MKHIKSYRQHASVFSGKNVYAILSLTMLFASFFFLILPMANAQDNESTVYSNEIPTGSPYIEVSIDNMKITRGETVELSVGIKNIGTEAAKIKNIDIILPSGFSSEPVQSSQCSVIGVGEQCYAKYNLFSGIQAPLGKGQVKVTVDYE